MTSEALRESVRWLLREHLTTFEQLDTLLYLRKHSDREHQETTLSGQLGIPREHLSTALHALTAIGLTVAGEMPATYRFCPRDPSLAAAVEALATAYREQSAAVLSTMSVYAIERIRSGPLRAFADSFIVGRRKDDG